MNPSPIGRRIREQREALRWSLSRLKEESGQLEQTISAIELGGSQEPKRSTVIPILDALGIPRHALVQAEEEMVGKEPQPA